MRPKLEKKYDKVKIAYQLLNIRNTYALKEKYKTRLKEIEHLLPIKISEIIIKEKLDR